MDKVELFEAICKGKKIEQLIPGMGQARLWKCESGHYRARDEHDCSACVHIKQVEERLKIAEEALEWYAKFEIIQHLDEPGTQSPGSFPNTQVMEPVTGYIQKRAREALRRVRGE
jgi:hypothetical protein